MPNDDRTATTKCQDALSQERVKRKWAEDKLNKIGGMTMEKQEVPGNAPIKENNIYLALDQQKVIANYYGYNLHDLKLEDVKRLLNYLIGEVFEELTKEE